MEQIIVRRLQSELGDGYEVSSFIGGLRLRIVKLNKTIGKCQMIYWDAPDPRIDYKVFIEALTDIIASCQAMKIR